MEPTSPIIARWFRPVALASALALAVLVVLAGLALGGVMPVSTNGSSQQRCIEHGAPGDGSVLASYGSTPTETLCEWHSAQGSVVTIVPSPWTEVAGYAAAMVCLAALPGLVAFALLAGYVRFRHRRRALTPVARRLADLAGFGLLLGTAAGALQAISYL